MLHVRTDPPAGLTSYERGVVLVAETELGYRLEVTSIPAAEKPSPAQQKPRILLIDDDLEAAELMSELLRLRGYACEVCQCADNGVRRWRERHHEVVVSDLNLRQQSGLEIARALTREHQRPVLIALTGQLDHTARRRSRAAGFDHHMVKPLELEVFEALLVEGNPARASA